MALVISLQGEVGIAATAIPGADQGVIAFKEDDQGVQVMIPVTREQALAWAAEIQRRFSGIEVATSMPNLRPRPMTDNPQA